MGLRHRKIGYMLLKGKGLEIGALHEKAPVPSRCQVDYCDAITRDQAMKLFPEIKKVHKFADVKFICNLDTQGLSIFNDDTYDFVILSHVIEHVANPINVINELFRIVKPGGLIVLSVPDKNFTFDRNREVTSFQHLLAEYRKGVTEVTDDHYLDFIKGVHPEWLEEGEDNLRKAIQSVRERREHAHVWTSDSFKEFLQLTFKELGTNNRLVMENDGHTNKYEYYSIWQKTDGFDRPFPSHSWINKIRLNLGI